MKSVMYHYVQPNTQELPFFKNLHFRSFQKQLDFFEAKFGFVSQEDFISSFDAKNEIPEGIVLTFDDGLKCHYDYVFDELAKRNLWGIFYVSTKPLISDEPLDVHLVHFLLGKYSDRVIYKELINILNGIDIPENKISEFERETYRTQNNSEYSLYIKRVLNYYLPPDSKIHVILELFKKFNINIKESFINYYLTPEEILTMKNNNMIIGSHSIDHPVMSSLSFKNQKKQIYESFSFLENILGELPIKTFCYPYGGSHSFNIDTINILKNFSCDFAFSVEQRDILSSDLKEKPLSLPRYDCNQFDHGKVLNNFN